MENNERQVIAQKIDTLMDGLLSLRREVLSHERDKRVPSNKDDVDGQRWVDPSEAAELFGVTSGHIRRLAKSGCGKMVGGRWIVEISAIRARLGR